MPLLKPPQEFLASSALDGAERKERQRLGGTCFLLFPDVELYSSGDKPCQLTLSNPLRTRLATPLVSGFCSAMNAATVIHFRPERIVVEEFPSHAHSHPSVQDPDC